MQALQRYFVFIILAAVIGVLAIPTQSFAAFLDDFQDGNHNGWLSANNGGISVDGVELHNGSLMAYAAHTGNGSPFGSASNENSLSRDFAYSANDVLSFDMHAVANSASTCCVAFAHGKAGVTVAFLNTFNVQLGSAGLYYSTSAGILAANELPIDSIQHHYAAKMSDFATLAGLNSASPIATISLKFNAFGQFVGGGNIYPNAHATANVWFDSVSAVPEPEMWAMLLVGTGLVGFQLRRKSKASEPNQLTPA